MNELELARLGSGVGVGVETEESGQGVVKTMTLWKDSPDMFKGH